MYSLSATAYSRSTGVRFRASMRAFTTLPHFFHRFVGFVVQHVVSFASMPSEVYRVHATHN